MRDEREDGSGRTAALSASQLAILVLPPGLTRLVVARDNAVAQRRSVGEQDGSEVRSVELERLLAEGLTAEERRNAFEFLRDHAADLHAAETGTA